MADQENRNPQHSDPQKPGSEQKPGNPPNQPTQHKQQIPSGQPNQSDQGKHDQEKKKAGLGA
jgi:hypothetical protein